MYFADDMAFEGVDCEKRYDKFEESWNVFVVRVIQSCDGYKRGRIVTLIRTQNTTVL